MAEVPAVSLLELEGQLRRLPKELTRDEAVQVVIHMLHSALGLHERDITVRWDGPHLRVILPSRIGFTGILERVGEAVDEVGRRVTEVVPQSAEDFSTRMRRLRGKA